MTRIEENSHRRLLAIIFSLGLPTMLEQLMQTAVQYIDVAMVGSLGTEATAAVGATSTVNWLIGSTVSALGVGFLAVIARALGASDRKLAARASAQTVLAVLVAGSVFTILPLALSRYVPIWMQVDPQIQKIASQYFFILYLPMLFRAASIIFGTALRGAGDTKTPMRIGILVNLVNVILNFFFIFPSRQVRLFDRLLWIPGAGKGVLGAAAASAIAYALGGICITVALFRHPILSPRLQSMKPDPEVLRPCLKIALPNMCQRFGTSLGYVAFASMINGLGEVATAAHTIANTVESAFYIPGYGMQTAAATLAGNTLGEGDHKKMKELSAVILKVEVLLMLLSGGLLFFFAPSMMRLFSNDAAVIALGATVLRMVALSEPFYGVSIIIEGMMQGVGRTITPFIYHMIGMWGVRIVGTFFCTELFSLGLEAAWACMILHNLLLFVFFFIHFKKGNWNPLHQKISVA